MVDYKMLHAVLVFAVIGLYNVPVLNLAESDIESKVDILEYLLHGVLKHEIADIKESLRNIQNDKPDHACCKTEQRRCPNQTSGDGIQRLVDEVTEKTKVMITAFSTEKKQLRRQKTFLTEALGVIRDSVNDHENQTRDLLDQMKDNHQVDFKQLMNNTEQAIDLIRDSIDDHKNQSLASVDHLKDMHQLDLEQLMNKIEFAQQQSQQKCDSVLQLVEKLSADIDAMKSNIDGIDRKTNLMKTSMLCQEGWIRQLNLCVLYVDTETKSWFDAQDYCKEHGGSLVEPSSSVALALLIEGGNSLRWWVGASDRANEGVWRWESTGRKIGNVLKWREHEPNNAGGSEDCVELEKGSHKINDLKCNGELRHFICEKKL